MKYILGVVSGEDLEGSHDGADAGVSIETLDNNGCFGDETTSTSRLLPRVESSMFKGICFGVSLDLLKKANIDFLFLFCRPLRFHSAIVFSLHLI